jgi:hypothetical protein
VRRQDGGGTTIAIRGRCRHEDSDVPRDDR